MGKKKRHQGDPGVNSSDDSTESCDENSNTVECPHIKRAVDILRVKKVLKDDSSMECQGCKTSVPKEYEMDSDYEFDLSVWLCLKCCHKGCGRAHNQHALLHFNTPHSELHALCVNTTSWSVWCYLCDNEINVTCRKKLLEAVDYVKKQIENAKLRSGGESILRMESQSADVILLDDANLGSKLNGNLFPRARGLCNLGNTCFFNSVVQCLVQTPYLLRLLQETSHAGQRFGLPGGRLKLDGGESKHLKPLEGTLEEWSHLTRILATVLEDMRNGRTEVYNPGLLFSRLTQRMPQFAGGHQHDSHELLRHLLEAVREEDLRRYQAVILERMGFSRKTDPSLVDAETRKEIKFYGQQASELLLPTEQVFRGVLVSTLQCQECLHTSKREEFFLDLSLPISERTIPPALRRKADEFDIKTKHQLKKEKRQAAKRNKKHKGGHRARDDDDANRSPSVDDNFSEELKDNKSESESDADVEDNGEDTVTTTDRTENGIRKGTESGYNSDKGSLDYSNRGEFPDSSEGGATNAVNAQIHEASFASRNCNSPSSSEANIEMGSPLGDNGSASEEPLEDFERPVSRLSFNKLINNTDLKADLEKLSLINDSENKVAKLFCSPDSEKLVLMDTCGDGAYGGYDGTQDEKMDEDCDLDPWANTMTARYQCEEGECSVQSCLNQFTACELLTNNNKVGCDVCTKRHGGAGKTVYTNATKQLLVANPPAVLILHLKRFQVLRFRSAKVNKYVTFPFLLDLAPFCSRSCQNLPSFENGQKRVLYSLYGVVEHSGSMHGGHYVAYVKVRSMLDNRESHWQFLPKNQKMAEYAISDRNDENGTCKGAEADPKVPSGKWYYVSDSFVNEVPESRVLKAQAYLLFYERIL